MARQYGHEKLDLFAALRLLAVAGGGGYGELVNLLGEAFACSERTAKDALRILKHGDYVELRRDPVDRRRRRYTLSERGQSLLADPNGEPVLRFARKLFTSCPSPDSSRRQRALSEPGAPERALEQAERLLLTPPHPEAFNPISNPRLPCPAAAARGKQPGNGRKPERSQQLPGQPQFDAAAQPLDAPGPAVPDLPTLREAAELLHRAGFAAIVSDLVIVEAQDTLAVIRVLNELEAQSFPAERAAMQLELQAFIEAVKTHVPQEQWSHIEAEYTRILAKRRPNTRRPKWLAENR